MSCRWQQVCLLAGVLGCAPIAFLKAQEPVPPPPADTATSPSVNATPRTGTGKYIHANDFLIRGTVFSEKALSFPGVELRIRRPKGKKFRWQGYTNSRGEFAVRVPKGAQYEVLVSAKGFKDQVRTIDAKSGLNEENAIFRMEPVTGDKR